MNKTVKGSLAGAAGIALLMGGFGSYALWQDSASLGSSQVTAGHLTVTAGTGWYDDTRDATGTQAAPDWTASSLMVPGDVIKYTQTFDLTGTGKNLKGTITLNALGAMTKADGTTVSNFSSLQRTVTLSDPDNAGTNFQQDSANPLKYSFSSPFNTATVTAVVTYTFPTGSSGSNNLTDQDAVAVTPAATFTIAQG